MRVVRDGDSDRRAARAPRRGRQGAGARQGAVHRPEPPVDDKTIFDHLVKTAPRRGPSAQSGRSPGRASDWPSAVVEQTYLNSYVAHAPMETHSAVAPSRTARSRCGSGRRRRSRSRPQVAQALGFPPRRCASSRRTSAAGSAARPRRGRRSRRRAREAVGQPVRVVWDREEEFFYDTFRPAAVVKIRSGLTGAGKIAFWDYRVVGAGERVPRTSTTSRTIGRRRREAGRAGTRPACTRSRRAVARAVGQHQHVRARVAHRRHGGEGRGRPGRVPPEEPDRRAHAARAGGAAKQFGWTPEGAERAGRRRGAAASYAAPTSR